MVRAAAVALCLALSAPCAAETKDYLDTGNGLLQSCTNESDQFGRGLCFGFILGSVQQFKVQQSLLPRKYVCDPDGVTNAQVVDLVVKYLRDHPENRQWPASMLVTNALISAWPCSRK